MKKIAIISPGGLPLPAVKGGAVETLIDYIIGKNEDRNLMEITVYSSFDSIAAQESEKYKKTKFTYIKLNNKVEKIFKLAIRILNKILYSKINVDILYIFKVKKMLKSTNFDFILIENQASYVLSLQNIDNDNILLHLHNDYLNSQTYKGKKIIERCSKVLTVSEYIKEDVLTLGNKYSKKVEVWKNCTDPKKFNRSLYGDFRNSFRKDHHISEKEIVFLFSGRIHPTKGIKELIIAFGKMNTKNCKLLIVGGSWFSSKKSSKFEKEMKKLSSNLNDKIIFTGYIPFENMPKIHAVADIVVVPSMWKEPAGLVIIEAMASGLPLITTNVGGISEYIDKENVILLKNDNEFIINLRDAMDLLASNEKKRNIISLNAQKYSQKFNPDTYYTQFINILETKNE